MALRSTPRRRWIGAASGLLLIAAALVGASGSQVSSARAAEPGQPSFLSDSTSVTPRAAGISAPTPVAGFSDSVVFSGLIDPTKVRFAPNGRVYVAQKSGQIVWYNSISDPTPHLWGDLGAHVDDYWDRGLLGMALAPNFPTDPTIYVQYAYDHNPLRDVPGDPFPAAPTTWNDACPSDPGPTSDGCPILGRISKLTSTPDGNNWTGAETVLVQDYCQQFPSHSNDDLWVGPDGFLYATAGDGASFNGAGSSGGEDFGQWGGAVHPVVTPANPCGDPPKAAGTADSAPMAQGGALRSQSERRAAGTAASLDGALLRIKTSDGSGAPGNPFAASLDPNRQRILAYGFRNPFRFTFRPGANEVWVGDVGYNFWEEIDRLSLPADAGSNNFGWPCVEGNQVQTYYPDFSLDLCNPQPNSTAPYYTYDHGVHIVANDGCTVTRGSSISGLAFYTGSAYPTGYRSALFFADHSRDCIWAMLPQANGDPDPANIVTVVKGAPQGQDCIACPVDLTAGPNGDIFYVNYDLGTIDRLSYGTPQALIDSDVSSGAAPLTVHFDGAGSNSPGGAAPLTYSWDLDGNGTFGDSSAVNPTRTYTTPGTYNVRLRVTDTNGVSATSPPYPIIAGDTPPTPSIDLVDGALPPTQPASNPPPAIRPNGIPQFYAVGDTISFSGHAADDQQGTLPAAELRWDVSIYHCPDVDCHTHTLQSFVGVGSGAFAAPQHDYPSLLQIKLTATDAQGLSASATVVLYPKTSTLSLGSIPSGLALSAGGTTGTTPFQATFIEGTGISLSAPSLQTMAGATFGFVAWSDGGRATHTITVPASDATYTATYARLYRIWGPDRYATSAAAAATYPVGPPTVFVASGTQFPDALSGAAIAGQQGGPVLLVTSTSIPASVSTALTALHPGRIVVLGGPAAVSDGVVSALAAYTSGGVTRIGGVDRYDTSARIARAAFPGGVGRVYIASGEGFADALSAAPLAAVNHAPLLLVARDGLPAVVATALGALHPAQIVIVGGEGAVSPAVASALEGYGAVSRIAGLDRYDTAAKVAALIAPGPNPDIAFLASGLAFPDALTAAGLAGLHGAPLLLVKSALPLPPTSAAELNALKPKTIVLVGGPGAVSDAVFAALAPFVGP